MSLATEPGCSASSGSELARRRGGAARGRHRGRPAQLREGLLDAETLVDLGAIVPRGIAGPRIGAGDDARRARGERRRSPTALREACRLAASPQLRNDGHRSAATCSSQTALLVLAPRTTPAACTAATAATRARASTASTRSSPTTSAPRRIPPTPPPRCSRSGRRVHDEPPRAAARRALPAARRGTTAR